MKWNEFASLLSGIGADSPLGRLVQIRLEDDKDVLKNFTSSQRKIRYKWRSRKAKAVTQEDTSAFLEQMKQAFMAMSK